MKYKLKDLIQSISNKFNFAGKSNVIFLNTSDIYDGHISGTKIKTQNLPGQAKKSLKNGDILFSEIRPKNKRFAIVKNIKAEDYVVSTKLMVLRNCNSNILDTRYFYFYLTSPIMISYLQSEAESRSGTFPQITFKDTMADIEINLPPLFEQKLVVKRIETISSEIYINNQINDNLLELMDKLFNSFFPNINVGYDQIGSFIKNYDRFRKPLSKKQRSEIPGNYRYIGATSVMDHINQYNFNGIYLLLGEDGTVVDDNGYPILQYIFGKFWPNNHTHVLKGKDISTEWLYLFFRQRKVSNIVTGAVQKKISQKSLHSLTFRSPSKDNCLKFDKIIQPIFKSIRIRMKENSSLFQLKQILLKRYF